MIIGLVGKPSSGKSSLFKASTLIDVKITGIPFCTIEPNVGIGYVSIDCVCKEFGVRCNPKTGYCRDGKRYVPVRLVDVGGLIPGSHLGKGIGNKFLDDLRQASVLIQIVDCSGLTDSEGKPTKNYDPNIEIKFLEEEIDLWFADVIKKALQKFERKIAYSRADLIQILAEQLSGLEVRKQHIEQALDRAAITDIENFARVIRKISKPILIAANKIDLKEAQQNFEKLKEKYEHIIPTSAEAEIALKKAAEKGLIEYLPGNDFQIPDIKKLDEAQLKALKLIKEEVIEKYGSTGVQDCLNKAVFELLNYIAVYPVADSNKLTDKEGNVLPDVFLVPRKTTVKELAFKVHTELGEKFICGIDARTKRRLASDYELKNNDVIEIAFAK
ncbi:MAG: redox-regulated ATPase YchF [Candidatus Aenigmarchaeota archaeon]|nr:redox-regulated ATPase YchF [Candidatus Aenigmarchaeota archaeon]